jgi:P4 family phage/plasmid primase-like protien
MQSNMLLHDFLNNHCRVKNGKFSHTTMPGGSRKPGSYYISNDKMNDFYDIYDTEVFDHGVPTHLNETPDPNRHSPFKVDFDFRYKKLDSSSTDNDSHDSHDSNNNDSNNNDSNNNDSHDASTTAKGSKGGGGTKHKQKQKQHKLVRRYTQIMIIEIVKMFYTVFKEWIISPFEEEQCMCFVFERKRPRYKNKDSKDIIKDGIHLMWPYMVCPFSFQQKIRTEMIKKIKESRIFDKMELINEIADVYDKGVIDGNWMMYGSCKPKHKPYKLTHIYKYIEDENDGENGDDDGGTFEIEDMKIDPQQYTPTYLIRILSIRAREDNQVTFKIHREKEIIELETKATKLKEAKRMKNMIHNPTDAERTDNQLEIIMGLVDILNPRRADNYAEWIQLIWCCHNIHNTDERLLDKVIEFSKKSEKYKNDAEESCRTYWANSKPTGLKEGTLRMWAKEDNFEEYNKVLKKSVWGKVKKSAVNPYFNSYDIAEIAYDMFGDGYICVDVEKNVWYKFNKERWKIVKGPVCLKKLLSTDLFNYFCDRPQEFMNENEEVDPKKWQMIAKNGSQLKQRTFKENVIQECKQFFNDPDDVFLEKLDEQRHLIAFNNGVMDLDNDELSFRSGRPDDYISMSTKIDYQEYSWTDPFVVEIIKLMSQILPSEDVREYVLTKVASFLHGSVKDEKFYFWTGSGGNGKGTLVTLINEAFGLYAGELPIQVLTSARQKPGEANAETARLKGVRAVFAQEPEEGKAINASLLKQYSGGDPVTARLLYGNPITFIPQFKIVVCCNELPKLPPMDGGVWRRVRVVHFGSRFVDYPDPKDPTQFKKDDTLKDKFKYYAQPFMWILMQKYKKYKRKGCKLDEPKEVTDATKDFKQEMDQFQEFINVHVIKSNNEKTERIICKEAHLAYIDWMNENYSDTKKLQLREFQKHVEQRLNQKYHSSSRVKITEEGRRLTGKKADGWWGYILRKEYLSRTPNDDDDDNAEDESDLSETLSDTSVITAEPINYTQNNAMILESMSNNILPTNPDMSSSVENKLINTLIQPNQPNQQAKKKKKRTSKKTKTKKKKKKKNRTSKKNDTKKDVKKDGNQNEDINLDDLDDLESEYDDLSGDIDFNNDEDEDESDELN